MKTFGRFWADECGFVVSSELVLIATIAVVGLLAGLTTLRDQVSEELGDTASAFKVVNQSYRYLGAVGHTGSTAGSAFIDRSDFCHGASDDNPPVIRTGIGYTVLAGAE